MKKIVKLDWLNLRHTDEMTVKCVLGKGHIVEQLLNEPPKKWHGKIFRLVKSEKYGEGWTWEGGLLDADAFERPVAQLTSTVQLLPRAGVYFPTNSDDLASRKFAIIPYPYFEATYPSDWQKASDFLKVETALAFQRSEMGTMCNIAAFQMANLFDCYIPRVQWYDNADRTRGALLGETVWELSANDLFRWFSSANARDCGWRQTDTPLLDCKTHLTIAVIKRKPIGHIGVLTPDGNMWQAGAKNTSAQPRSLWEKWVYSGKNSGSLFFTQKPR
jgi:hypothetical protein